MRDGAEEQEDAESGSTEHGSAIVEQAGGSRQSLPGGSYPTPAGALVDGVTVGTESRYIALMAKDNLTALEAMARLVDGNRRYTQNVRSVDSMLSHSRRDLQSQRPFAIILGCSDSRAPAEVVFDQGLGDLFVIRVAGNIVAPSQVGSVEFAAERFGTRLVVVMGHSSCGAIEAALEAVLRKAGPASRNMMSIVDRVRPSIESLVATELANDPVRLRREATRANVRSSVSHLRHSSEVIEGLAAGDGLLVVGAELDLATGVVEFFDGAPELVTQPEKSRAE